MFASVIKSISTFEYMQAALFENIFEKKTYIARIRVHG